MLNVCMQNARMQNVWMVGFYHWDALMRLLLDDDEVDRERHTFYGAVRRESTVVENTI